MPAHTEDQKEPTSLSSIIFRRMLAIASILIVVFGVVIISMLYVYLGGDATETLQSESEQLAVTLEAAIDEDPDAEPGQAPLAVLAGETVLVDSEIRITLIDPDGEVLYDSVYDASSLENHSDRDEFLEAVETGEGSSGRYSETYDEETIYYAVLLSDGSVVRLAVVRSSALGMLLDFLPAILGMVVVGVLVSYVVSKRTAKKVTDALLSVDLDNPASDSNTPEELVPLVDKLEQQKRKLDEQDLERRRFTSNASHELKTPLTVISGYAELISEGIAKPEDVNRFAGLIYDESKHMKAIVDDLLTLNRLDDIGKAAQKVDLEQDVSLDDVASNAVDRLAASAGDKNVLLKLDVPRQRGSSEIFVKGNRQLLEELARNIVENAIRYNVEGGFVDVVVSRDGRGRPQLVVRDSGIGIPIELREKVFERFYCVDEGRSRATGGSGLGLAIVKHTAQLHGAIVNIRGNSPKGTIFEVIFPDTHE